MNGLGLKALSLGMHLNLSCLLYEILALISAAVTAAGSPTEMALSSVVKTAATAGKKKIEPERNHTPESVIYMELPQYSK